MAIGNDYPDFACRIHIHLSYNIPQEPCSVVFCRYILWSPGRLYLKFVDLRFWGSSVEACWASHKNLTRPYPKWRFT